MTTTNDDRDPDRDHEEVWRPAQFETLKKNPSYPPIPAWVGRGRVAHLGDDVGWVVTSGDALQLLSTWDTRAAFAASHRLFAHCKGGWPAPAAFDAVVSHYGVEADETDLAEFYAGWADWLEWTDS